MLIRNLLLAQHDGNAAIVLAGPATGVVRLLGLYRSGPQITAKCRELVVAAGSFPPVHRTRRSRAMWPRPGSSLPSGRRRSSPSGRKSERRCRIRARASTRTSRGRPRIRSSTPTARSSRCRTMRRRSALAAVLHAVHPDDGYFTLSRPGHDHRARRRAHAVHAGGGRQASLSDRRSRTERADHHAVHRHGLRAAGAAAPTRPRCARMTGTGMRRHAFCGGSRGERTDIDAGGEHQVVGTNAAVAVRFGEADAGAEQARRAEPPSEPAAPKPQAKAGPSITRRPPQRSPRPRRRCSRRPAASATTPPTSPAGSTSSLYTSVESLAADRDRWELILTKLKSQEMPPEDVAQAGQGNRDAGQVPREGVRARRRGDEAGSRAASRRGV